MESDDEDNVSIDEGPHPTGDFDRTFIERVEREERRVASLPTIADASGCGEWTTVVQEVSDLLPALEEAGAIGSAYDPSVWVQNQHRFSRIHVKHRNSFRYLSDDQFTLLSKVLLPRLRALRIDDLVEENIHQGPLNGRCVCNMAWQDGRGLHYFCPLDFFSSTLVRLELRGTDRIDEVSGSLEVIPLHLPSLTLDKLTCLRYLKLSNVRFETDEDVACFGSSCQQLHHLVLECCGWTMENTVEKLSEAFQKTNLLTFTNLGTSSRRTNLRTEPQPRGYCFQRKMAQQLHGHRHDLHALPALPDSVEEIDLSCATAMGLHYDSQGYISSSIPATALTNIPLSLRRIKLAFCPFIDNDTVTLLASTSSCQECLEQVNLDGTSVTDVSPLLQCKKLCVLEIRFAACPTDPQLDPAWKERQQGGLCAIYWEPARTSE